MMRSEQAMLKLILDTAQNDSRIRGVILNGSRANPQARRDFFQDFDIVYLVTDVEPFRRNLEWIKRFGEMMILQMPDDMGDPLPDADNGRFAYLMQFMDGNRIDLTFFPYTRRAELKGDSLSVVLMDKDGLIEPFPAPSEADYLPKAPNAKAFADCCNEFWWVCPYVAKGLWREEIVYARTMLDEVVRQELMKMLAWHIGMETGFTRNPGKLGKYFKAYLAPELWAMLEQTYADASYAHSWEALFAMGALFRKVATGVAAHFGFAYPHEDDQRVSAHLRHVRDLPRDAETMY